MMCKELTTWFQEELKKEIAEAIEHKDTPEMAVSLHDEDGVVWAEGFKHAKIGSVNGHAEYLIQYSIHREKDFPFSISITVVE